MITPRKSQTPDLNINNQLPASWCNLRDCYNTSAEQEESIFYAASRGVITQSSLENVVSTEPWGGCSESPMLIVDAGQHTETRELKIHHNNSPVIITMAIQDPPSLQLPHYVFYRWILSLTFPTVLRCLAGLTAVIKRMQKPKLQWLQNLA